MRVFILSVLAMGLMACSGNPDSGSAAAGLQKTCTSPRPEICTMDYNPVCGQLEKGGFEQFSNGCGACADPRVVGYNEGPCPR